MNKLILWLALLLSAPLALQAQNEGRYIEVTGTSEIEIVPDKIHYIIEIREYFEEEFDGKSKPEEYRTKVPLASIESGLRKALEATGVPAEAIRTQEVGDYWRKEGQDFLVSKQFDITLDDFQKIDDLIQRAQGFIPPALLQRRGQVQHGGGDGPRMVVPDEEVQPAGVVLPSRVQVRLLLSRRIHAVFQHLRAHHVQRVQVFTRRMPLGQVQPQPQAEAEYREHHDERNGPAHYQHTSSGLSALPRAGGVSPKPCTVICPSVSR